VTSTHWKLLRSEWSPELRVGCWRRQQSVARTLSNAHRLHRSWSRNVASAGYSPHLWSECASAVRGQTEPIGTAIGWTFPIPGQLVPERPARLACGESWGAAEIHAKVGHRRQATADCSRMRPPAEVGWPDPRRMVRRNHSEDVVGEARPQSPGKDRSNQPSAPSWEPERMRGR
jgi:hypothetical protein